MDVPSYPRTTCKVEGRELPEIRGLRDEVLSKVGTAVGLVDVRSPEEFRGEKLAPDHLPQEQSQVHGVDFGHRGPALPPLTPGPSAAEDGDG